MADYALRQKSTSFRFIAATVAISTHPARAASQPAQLAVLPSHSAPFEGGRVHYKDLGAGPDAVVFVHGWNCDLSVWDHQLPALGGVRRAIFIDLPGFGQSSAPAGRYSMEHLARGVDAVLRKAGVSRVVLVGHSMGAPVSRQFYRDRPDAVLGLVIVDGALRFKRADTAQVKPMLTRLGGPDYQKFVSKMMGGMVSTMSDSVARQGIMRTALATPKQVSVSAMREMFELSIWTDDPIRVPAMAVMAGTSGWDADYEAYVRRLAPGVQYVTMEGAGHFLMIERATEFNELLRTFLQARGLFR
jgi:pimeloyl-ACP methyl ester carboxylesterase